MRKSSLSHDGFRTGFQPLLFMRHARCASYGMSIGRAVSCRRAPCIAGMRFRSGRKMDMVSSRPMVSDTQPKKGRHMPFMMRSSVSAKVSAESVKPKPAPPLFMAAAGLNQEDFEISESALPAALISDLSTAKSPSATIRTSRLSAFTIGNRRIW